MKYQMLIEFEAPPNIGKDVKVFEALVPLTVLSVFPAPAAQPSVQSDVACTCRPNSVNTHLIIDPHCVVHGELASR